MKDTEITNIINIPASTLSDWKIKDVSNWRKIIYELLSNTDKEELIKKVEAIRLLKGLE